MGLRAAELFAGVGGFRLGLEAAGHEVIWWNQWEPSTKTVQYAYHCYREAFKEPGPLEKWHNTDISKVPLDKIPEHDLLVGGFPCQDYSVMTSLRSAQGLRGKKGILWWEIERIVAHHRPEFLLLENVPRLLLSPTKERGRDFAVILRALADLGYVVEWRVITGDSYGVPQRRKRVFIFAARRKGPIGKALAPGFTKTTLLTKDGFFGSTFKVQPAPRKTYPTASTMLPKDFGPKAVVGPFEWQNAGIMVGGRVHTMRVEEPAPESNTWLMEHVDHARVPDKYYLSDEEVKAWEKAKQPRSVERTVVDDEGGRFTYRFAEGRLQFPENMERAARTILTSERNRTPNRTTHVIQTSPNGRYRFLTPEECEHLMGFPKGHTEAIPERWRYFTMGNALLVDLVKAMGFRLAKLVETYGTLNEPVPTPSEPPGLVIPDRR